MPPDHDDDPPPLPALEFTPVPRAKDRSNGWKPEVQRAFIEALAETGSVAAACRRVGRADHGAYLLRRHPQAASFRAAWDAALDLGICRIEDAAMDRALYGTEVTHLYHGEVAAITRRFNERLVMFMLRNRAPHRFTEGKAKALIALDKAKLKKQWHAEWKQAQHAESVARDKKSGEDLLDKIKWMHRNWYCTLSPATRAAYRTFREAQDRDKADPVAWYAQEDPEPVSVAEAEYEEFFNRDRDKRPHLNKLVDIREWENPAYAEEEEDGAGDEGKS